MTKHLKTILLLAICAVVPVIPALIFFEYITSRMYNYPTFVADRFVRLFYKD
jgi:hypothetical protein